MLNRTVATTLSGILLSFAVACRESPQPKPKVAEEPADAAPPTIQPRTTTPADPWRETAFPQNPMDERQRFGATSEWVRPLSPMGFPYDHVAARIVFQCYTGSPRELTYIDFNGRTNFRHIEAGKFGTMQVWSRIRWNREKARLVLWTLGSDGSYIRPYDGLFGIDIERLTDGVLRYGQFLLEIGWYAEGVVHFKWSLTGSARAIQNARAKCRGR